MGNGRLSKVFGACQPEIKIMILGLDSSGKTTLLYRLGRSEVTVTVPTIGMNVESTTFKDVQITSWDVGGRDKIRPLLWHYYRMADALVFMVDSADREWGSEMSRDELHKLLKEEYLGNLPVLVLANKQDLPSAMTVSEVSDRLGLDRLRRDTKRVIEILPVSALTGEGVPEALDWIKDQLTHQRVREALVKPAKKATPPPVKSLFTSLSSALKQTLGGLR